MRSIYFFALILLLPVLALAQSERKGTYGSVALGYGSYKLDLYGYDGGSDSYADQTFSGFVLALGLEKKSAWRKNNLVFDLGGELTGGFGIKTEARATGNVNGEGSGGYAFGIRSLLRMGYLFTNSKGTVVPLIGLGPYFTYLQSGGSEAPGNYIYGLQASLGVDLQWSRFVLTPEVHFGIASWGFSDEMSQNGQPGMVELRLKIAGKF